MKTIRLAAAILFAGLFLSPGAHAAAVDPFPFGVFLLGNLSAGDHGTLAKVNTEDYSTEYDYTVGGVLSAKTQIALTLTVKSEDILSLSNSKISATTPGRGIVVDGITAANLIVASFSPGFMPVSFTQTSPGVYSSSFVIKNFANDYLTFGAEMKALVNLVHDCSHSLTTLKYKVTSVPLPAAALLFGSGLASLVGFARKKARR